MKLRVKFLLLAFVLVAQGQLGPRVASTLEVVPFPPYHAAGNDVPTTFRPKRGGDPVTLEDLEIAHTEKIHLLIIDESLTDYGHQHPSATEMPGSYRFVLQSKYGGTYFVWAQLVPKSTGTPEFSNGTVAVEGRAKSLEQIISSTAGDQDGYRYELSVEGRSELAVGDPARLKVTVRKPDGTPAENLEPVMGAFGTLAAFSGNLQEAILSFPTDSAPASEAARGGPELTFQLTPRSSGYWRLFIQTKKSGFTRLASFRHKRQCEISTKAQLNKVMTQVDTKLSNRSRSQRPTERARKCTECGTRKDARKTETYLCRVTQVQISGTSKETGRTKVAAPARLRPS